MRSLRARLTLSYAFVTALALGLVLATLSRPAIDLLTRPINQSIDEVANKAAVLASSNPASSTDAIVELIVRQAARPGVLILGPPPQRLDSQLPFPGRFSPGAGAFGGGPGGGGPPGPPPAGAPGNRPFDGFDRQPGFGQFGAISQPRGPGDIRLKSVLGIYDRSVPVGNSRILVTAAGEVVDNAIHRFFQLSIFTAIALLAISWLVGRWVSSLAIVPLTRVTEELRRFAGGDFSQRQVMARDHAELGELIDAYNGAAAQVSAAFAERQRVEEHMRRFIADAGHELRTPLTIIGGFLQLLERGGYESPDVRTRAFETLARETRRMRALVERLMALARLERPEPTDPSDVDLPELTKDAIDSLAAARNGEVVLQCADTVRVYADPAELHEAVSNLVDNALKYGSGTVGVEIARNGTSVTLRVRNRGKGIAPRDRERIFERFYRGEQDEHSEGSGLGLAIAQRAAQRAGGTLVLENGEPGDTVFALTLPAGTTAA